jgi:hypothetical protein
MSVGLHACKQLNARRQVIFLTAFELSCAADFVRRAQDDGYEIIIVPETTRKKLPSLRDALDNLIRDLDRYRDEWQDSFRFTFVDPSDFSDTERAVWGALPRIFAARGGRPRHVRDVLVSETMRLMEGRYQEAVGVWEPAEGRIMIKPTQAPVPREICRDRATRAVTRAQRCARRELGVRAATHRRTRRYRIAKHRQRLSVVSMAAKS